MLGLLWKKVIQHFPYSNRKHYKVTKPLIQPDVGSTNISYIQVYRYATGLDKFLLILGLISCGISGALQPLSPLMYGEITGDIVEYVTIMASVAPKPFKDNATAHFLDNMKDFAIKHSAIGVGMLVFGYIATAAFNYSAMRQIYKLRSIYLSKVLNQDIPWYDVRQTGDFASRISDDLLKFEDGIGEKVPMFLCYMVIFVVSTIIALVKGWELALICLIPFPATCIVMYTIAWLAIKIGKKELDAYAEAGAIAEEALTSIRTVTAFGGQNKEEERYNRHLVVARDHNIKRSIFSGLAVGIIWLVIFGSNALSFWYGVDLVIKGRSQEDPVYTIQNMITVFFSAMTGFQSFGLSAPYLETFGIAKAAASKIFSVLNSEPTINKSKNLGEEMTNVKGNIKLQDVIFHYPSREDVRVLKKVNLNIKAGDTVALVGSSGCGKSTIVQLIQRFYDPVSGAIELDGRNIKDLNLRWLRSIIGVVGQEPVLFGTTIKENIKYGHLEASDEDVVRAAKRANAHEFITSLPKGYNTMVGERGAQLSGGQKQRIAIARALVRNPTILLLDEATSALDNTSEAKVQAALDSASRECTTIIVAHRLSTIRNAHKIIVLSDGSVVEEGTHEELMALRGEYYKLVVLQVNSVGEAPSDNERKIFAHDEDTEENLPVETVILGEQEDDEAKESVSLTLLLRMNSPEWPYILLAAVASGIVGVGMPVFSVLFGDVIGVLSNTDNDFVKNETKYFCIVMAIIGVVLMVSSVIQSYVLGVAGEKLTERLRRLLFRSILTQEMAYFDLKENGVGALCARLSTDAASVQGATGQRVGAIMQSVVTFAAALGVALYYDWRLGLVTLSFTPVQMIAIYVETRNTTGLNDQRGTSLAKSTKLAVESITNIRTVASLGLEEIFHKIYVSELLPYYKQSLGSVHYRGFVYGLSKATLFFAYSASMYYGGFLIRDGMEYEKIFKVSQALMLSTAAVATSLAFTPNLNRGLEAAKNIKNILKRVPTIQNMKTPQEMIEFSKNIVYGGVNFSYPNRPGQSVLKELNLDVVKGKTVALVGQSGCGKSTVMQLMERFYDPDSGNVSIDSDDIKCLKLESLRSLIGIVSQEPNLFSRTIAENIAYGDNSRVVTDAEIIEAARSANIHNFIVSLPMGYKTKLGEKGTQLSGGQTQRIAIARALVRNPKLLLLDEATSALDAESEMAVQQALDKAKVGRTVITIAHRLSTIQDADVICVINEGKIVEQGAHQELLELRGIYYRLQQLQ